MNEPFLHPRFPSHPLKGVAKKTKSEPWKEGGNEQETKGEIGNEAETSDHSAVCRGNEKAQKPNASFPSLSAPPPKTGTVDIVLTDEQAGQLAHWIDDRTNVVIIGSVHRRIGGHALIARCGTVPNIRMDAVRAAARGELGPKKRKGSGGVRH